MVQLFDGQFLKVHHSKVSSSFANPLQLIKFLNPDSSEFSTINIWDKICKEVFHTQLVH